MNVFRALVSLGRTLVDALVVQPAVGLIEAASGLALLVPAVGRAAVKSVWAKVPAASRLQARVGLALVRSGTRRLRPSLASAAVCAACHCVGFSLVPTAVLGCATTLGLARFTDRRRIRLVSPAPVPQPRFWGVRQALS